MNEFVESFAYWLADYYLATTVLLAAALVAMRVCRQPVKRLAVAKAALVAVALLAALCALPGWSLVHLAMSGTGPQAAPNDAPAASRVQSPIVMAEPPSVVPAVPRAEVTPPVSTSVARPVALSWPTIAVTAYTLGSGATLLWLAIGIVFARRLLRNSAPAPFEIREILANVMEGVGRQPRLRMSNAIDVAAALGVWRPIILLPSCWASSRTARELQTVLAHECAHVRNGDLKWLALSRLLSITLWLQPLYWFLRRVLRVDQEALADAAAAEQSSRQTYAEQLVAWARNVGARPRPLLPASVGLWEGASQLRRRVAMLLDERLTVLRRCPRPWGLAATATVALLAAILSTATLSPSAAVEAGRRDTTSATELPAGVRTLPSGTRVEIVAIGTDSKTELTDQWWRADGTLLKSIPFHVGGGSVKPDGDQMKRQFVMRLLSLPPHATVRWRHLGQVGPNFRGEVLLDGQESSAGYYAERFCIRQDQASFGLRVDVAAGDWTTVVDSFNPGGRSEHVLRDGESVAFTQAFSITVPHWGESAAVVVSHSFLDNDVRVVAVDKAGEHHTAGKSSVISARSKAMTQFDFLRLKPEEIDRFEFQTREFQSVEVDDLPTQPDTSRAAVDFHALASELATADAMLPEKSGKTGEAAADASPASTETQHSISPRATVTPFVAGNSAEMPDRVVVGNRYVLCKVTTDLQRSLLGNVAEPRTDASACLLVNFTAFADEQLTPESPALKELSTRLARWARIDDRRLVATVLLRPSPDNEEPSKSRELAYSLAKQLPTLATAAGYQHATWSVTHLGNLSFDWNKFIAEAESMSKDAPADAEQGIGDARVKVFAVQTFLSHLLVNADCVTNIIPVVKSSGVHDFPANFEPDVKRFVPQLQYVRKEKILLRIRCTLSTGKRLDHWVGDRQARERFAAQVGFHGCSLGISYVDNSVDNATPHEKAGIESPEAADDSSKNNGGRNLLRDIRLAAEDRSDSASASDRRDSPIVASEAKSIAEDEVAGQVVDEAGEPLAGVTVDAWTWFPGNETVTDDAGGFSLAGFDAREPVELQFTKSGYCPHLFLAQPVGKTDWVVTLNDNSYIEGRVLDPKKVF